ncbi:MAG: hypothetical protein B6D68_00685 [spirochete symbiont of Stewartia floridana]|nr:MAG: hypothetical protein B6D68_00685 [spirochete symbiont of Stewartia floridana]
MNFGKTENLETLGRTAELHRDESRSHSDCGQAVYSARFLRLTGLYESWRKEMPLRAAMPREKKTQRARLFWPHLPPHHNRYARIASIRGDAVLRKCFGIKKIVSGDSLRRNLLKLDPEAAHCWMSKLLKHSYEPYILDIDDAENTSDEVKNQWG